MKKLILLSLIIFFGSSCFAQLPDLIGSKATINELKGAYGDYNVDDGNLLNVRSGNQEDNIYLNASISGNSFDYKFILSSNNNGIVNRIMYYYDNIEEGNFNFLKSTIIKVHKAQYQNTNGDVSIYTSSVLGIRRNILFGRKRNGSAIVTFSLQ